MTGMQKELQGARQEACRHGQRCSALEAELGQVMKESEDSCRLRAQQECSRRQLASARREVARLKDEKCDLYVRYTAAIEEKASVNLRSRDLNLKVGVGRRTFCVRHAFFRSIALSDVFLCSVCWSWWSCSDGSLLCSVASRSTSWRLS